MSLFPPRREQLSEPLHGFKLAHPMLSADRTQAGFSGITLGRSQVYGVTAVAECAQGAQHRSPSRWCDCGFYCLNALDDVIALAQEPDYRQAVLLEIAASGRFMRHERGLRYARQRITAMRAGRCDCGHPASVLAESADCMMGWRRLLATCMTCAGLGRTVTFAEFSQLLGGLPVTADEPAPAPSLDEVDRDALVPLLAAEVALLQARLDELQRQLARLTTPE
jgi:hypothetical protein